MEIKLFELESIEAAPKGQPELDAADQLAQLDCVAG